MADSDPWDDRDATDEPRESRVPDRPGEPGWYASHAGVDTEPADGDDATGWGNDDRWRSTAERTERAASPRRAVPVAIGLAILGPVLMVVVTLGVSLANLVLSLPLAAVLAVSLVGGQYLGFAGLAVAYLRHRGLDREGIASYLGLRKPTTRDLVVVLVGWMTIFGTLIVVSILVTLLGLEPGANQTAELGVENPELFPLLMLAMFLVVGPCEEILFRGVVQGRLREALPAGPSILLASVLFAGIHVAAVSGGLTARLTTVTLLFVPSVVLGIVYEYTENLVAPALLHAIHNAVLIGLLWAAVSQGQDVQNAGTAILTLL